jgi:hypothetical protein
MLSHDDEVPAWGDYRSFGDPNKKGETMSGVSGD